MKKILALILAALLVMSMTAAMAADYPDPEPVTLHKAYYTAATATSDSPEAPAILPNEEITLEFVNKNDGPELTFTPNPIPVTEDADSNIFDIEMSAELDDFGLGVYEYEITEKTPDPKAQGATYSTDTIGVKLYVLATGDTYFTLTTPKSEGSDEKLDTFTNTYDVGQLTVKKTIEGKLASPDQKFTIHVTFTAEEGKTVQNTISYDEAGVEKTIDPGWTDETTIDIKLKKDDTAVFTNIPAGVTYTVVEDDVHRLEDGAELTVELQNDPKKGYTVTGEVDKATEIAADAEEEVTINNKKDIDIDTGITLDSLPYVLIAVIALAGVALMIIRRRKANED